MWNAIKEKKLRKLSRAFFATLPLSIQHWLPSLLLRAADSKIFFIRSYSPDLAYSHFSFSQRLNLTFTGRNLTQMKRWKKKKSCTSPEENYFFHGIEMLLKHCIKCVELGGEHIGKWFDQFFPSFTGRKLMIHTM